MDDVTPAREQLLARLFEMHHERLVRALRARLGRYDWDLAEAVAARTWQLAAGKLDHLAASDSEEFAWLAELARTAQVAHLRAIRDAADGAKVRAYVLPSLPPVQVAIPFPATAHACTASAGFVASGVAA